MSEFTRRRAARGVSRLLSGDVTSREAAKINPWLSSDDEYCEEVLSNFHILNDLDTLAGDEELLALVEQPLRQNDLQLPVEKKTTVGKMKWAIVASFLLAAVSLLWLMPLSDQLAGDQMLRYVTRVGEIKKIDLDDGSIVHLNTSTEVLVSMNEGRRRVILQRGEALFNVQKDPARPFVVESGMHAITVLGTDFNVRKYPTKLRVAVADGLVALHPAEVAVSGNARLLSAVAGDGASLSIDNQVHIPKGWVAEVDSRQQLLSGYLSEGIDAVSGWTSGILEFDRMELYKIIKELNRYSAKKILIEDNSIMNLKVYAMIRIDQIDVALSGLQSSMPIEIDHYFDRIVITAKK